MIILLSMFAVTASCVPTAQPRQTEVEITRAFFAAMSASDQVGLGKYVSAGARFVVPSQQINLDLVEAIGTLGAQGAGMQLLEVTPGPNGEVHVRTQIPGESEQPATLKIAGGCIVEMGQA